MEAGPKERNLNDEKEFAEEGYEIINDRRLICLYYEKVHASVLFRKTFKTWRKKVDINKTYAKFPHSGPNKKKIVSIINQHLEHQVSSTPWLIALYMKKYKTSSIKWKPYTSLHMKRNQSMIKSVLTTSPQQQVLM